MTNPRSNRKWEARLEQEFRSLGFLSQLFSLSLSLVLLHAGSVLLSSSYVVYWVLVMVNFMCQLDWVSDAQIAGKTLFLSVSVRMFQERLAFESTDWIKISLTSVAGIIQFLEGLKRTERQRKAELALLLELGHPPSPVPLDIDVPDSWPFGLRLELTPFAPLVLRTLGLDRNYTASFSGPPACGWQIRL